jgi:pimeloyl-ACP methyl ester carboxylesterase
VASAAGRRAPGRAPLSSAPDERRVDLPRGGQARIWERGQGEPLGFLGGLRGLPAWPPVLERLARRRRVIAPSLPGFPGATGHRALDDLADWVTATLDLLEAAGLDGADLVGASVGAALAAEVAAFSRASVRRLVLVAPLGLFDPGEPVADVFAATRSELGPLLSSRPEALEAFLAGPGADDIEWQIESARAQEAAARLLWPTGDLGLARRLHRIQAPTLLVRGSEDRVVPASYAKRFADGISGPVQIAEIVGAGHVAELDAPDAVADAIDAFLG